MNPIEHQRTSSAFLFSRLLSVPFSSIFSLLLIILYKDLHATPLQITIAIALRPVASLFAPYWSASIHAQDRSLILKLSIANIIKYLPFLFAPFVDNPWFYVLSFGYYMMLTRGMIPTWMEILKKNVKGISMERVFAYGSAFEYIGGAILPIMFGFLLDGDEQAWRYIFPAAALVGMFSAIFIYRIPASLLDKMPAERSFKQHLMNPWKESLNLLKKRPDFLKFQIGFMWGGAGLMVLQPVLPKFFVDVLDLSYLEVAMALTVCKGIGFALTSPFWIIAYRKMDIFQFSRLVIFLISIFPLCLLASQFNLIWLYIGYLAYGMMQVGSEMSWNLSGPVFAKQEDSSKYSVVNVLAGGIRGSIFPLLGTLLYEYTNAATVLVLGSVFCLISTYQLKTSKARVSSKVSLEESV